MAGGTPAIHPQQTLGWMFQLLPYLEEGNVYATTAWNTLKATAIPGYFCPARPRRAFVYNAGRNNDGTRAMNDYVAVTTTAGATTSWSDTLWQSTNSVIVPKNSAGFVVRSVMITDGLSETIVVSEKGMDPAFYIPPAAGQTSACPYEDQGFTDGWDNDTIVGPTVPVRDKTGVADLTLGSRHDSGPNVLFADGSVKTIRYGTTTTVINALAGRSDGIVVSDSQY
jgi:prepilin-type processing-associated H-X9-DG protein